MHGGAKDFSINVRYNAIKRFLNEKLAILDNTIGKNFSSMNQEKNGNIGRSKIFFCFKYLYKISKEGAMNLLIEMIHVRNTLYVLLSGLNVRTSSLMPKSYVSVSLGEERK